MNDSFELQHFYHGKLFPEGHDPSGFTITARVRDLAPEQALQYQRFAQPGSYAGMGVEKLHFGLSFLQYDEQIFLISAYYPASRKDRGIHPDYHCVIVPSSVVYAVGSLRLLEASAPHFEHDLEERKVFEKETILAPLLLEIPQECHLEAYHNALALLPGVNAELIGPLLSMILDGPALQIIDAPNDAALGVQRLDFVKGLTALLPQQMQPMLTFATDVFDASAFRSARLKIVYPDPLVKKNESDITLNWGKGRPKRLTTGSYAILIAQTWRKDPTQAAGMVHEMTGRLARVPDLLADPQGAAEIASQTIQALHGIDDGTTSAEHILNVLVQDATLTRDEQDGLVHYAMRLGARDIGAMAETLLDAPDYRPHLVRLAEVISPMVKQYLCALGAAQLKERLASWEYLLAEGDESLYAALGATQLGTLLQEQPCSFDNQSLFRLAHVCLQITSDSLALEFLEKASPDQQDDVDLARSIANVVFQWGVELKWQDSLLVNVMGRLYLFGWKELSEDDVLGLLQLVQKPDIEKGILNIVFSWILETANNQERIRLLQRLVTVLQTPSKQDPTRTK